MSAALLFAAALSLGSPALHIVSSSVSADFERALRIERPELQLTVEADADLSARVERGANELELRIDDLKAARARLERKIPITEEEDAAMRVAVLLTLSALDRGGLSAQTSTPTRRLTEIERAAEGQRPSVSVFSLHVVAGSGLWLDQPAPQLSFATGLIGRWSWLRAGVELGAYGVLCCDRENDAVVSSWTELAIDGLVGATLLEQGGLRVAFDLGAGLLAVLGQAAPADQIFASAGQPITIDHLGLGLKATAEAELALSASFALLARAGLRVAPLRRSFVLPEAFQSLGEPLESPVIAPFLHLGLRFFFF